MAAETKAKVTGNGLCTAPLALVPAGPAGRRGLLLGVVAVAFWSFGSSLVYLGAKESGTWFFVAVASLTGGTLQMIFRRMHQGELRTALRLPWRLWAAPVACFVLYGLAWPLALATSKPWQVFGVSLINYLWPVLTVVFSVWWVPGVRLTGRLVLALLLALSGLVAANFTPLRELISAGTRGDAAAVRDFLPYALAFAAAVTWAIYSALLVRWRDWARNYVTSPLGFILTGLIACVVMASTGKFEARLTPLGTWLTVLYGAGPLAAGYLLWELALPKAKVQAMSLVAAATPLLSTLWLCLFLRTMPGPELICAAFLVGGGVVLSLWE